MPDRDTCWSSLRNGSGKVHADDQSAHSKTPQKAGPKEQDSAIGNLPSEEGRLLAGQNDYTEKAELGFAESGTCAAFEWERGHRLYPG